MFHPSQAHTHYKCSLPITEGLSGLSIPGIIALVGEWFRGKRAATSDLIACIQTNTINWEGSSSRLRTIHHRHGEEHYWAFRFDEQLKNGWRTWRTEFVLSWKPETDQAYMTCALMHWTDPNYISMRTSHPQNSIPRFIRDILSSRSEWLVQDGGFTISSTARIVEPMTMESVAQFIENPNRILPVILIDAHSSDKASFSSLDLSNMAFDTMGVAHVFYFESKELADEFKYFVGHENRLPTGGARVYLGNTSASKILGRFFTSKEVGELGARSIIEFLVDYTNRKLFHSVPITFPTFERLSNESALLHLTQKVERLTKWKGLKGKVRAQEVLIQKLKQSQEEALNDLLEMESIKNQLDEEKQLRWEYEAKLNAIQFSTDSIADNSIAHLTLRDVISLPNSCHDVLKQITAIFSSRVIALESAYEELSHISHYKDIRKFWDILAKSIPVLYSLHFEVTEFDADFDDKFKVETGFEHSLREKSLTREQSKMMKEREIIYDSVTLLAEPHIKWDTSDGKSRRIYYAPYAVQRKIIIAHSAVHLTTAGTKRRRR